MTFKTLKIIYELLDEAINESGSVYEQAMKDVNEYKDKESDEFEKMREQFRMIARTHYELIDAKEEFKNQDWR